MPNYSDSDRVLDRALSGSSAPGESVHQTIRLHRSWLREPDTLTLTARYRLVSGDGGARIRATVGPHELFLDEPMQLSATAVAKPWGRELWLTGIEARGESGVRTNAGVLPLSQYLALAPRRLAGGSELVLLKVLDPLPEPVLGDLYVEAHESKHEVYVVSRVHEGAWPDGRGAIRYGMNQALRRRYGNDAAFRRDYLDAVRRYEAVRRAVDSGAFVAPEDEARLRAATEAFTELRRLAPGDVVVVPTWLPHSLQHGVRVIEFQTPVYERYILSFNQRVLTQDRWDTETAVPRIRLDMPTPTGPERLRDGMERIASVDGFRVWRMVVEPDAEIALPDHPSYVLCVVLRGRVRLGALTLGAEQAAFVPALALTAGGQRRRLGNRAGQPATVLLAAPDL